MDNTTIVSLGWNHWNTRLFDTRAEAIEFLQKVRWPEGTEVAFEEDRMTVNGQTAATILPHRPVRPSRYYGD